MLDYDLFDPIVDVTHPFFSSLDCPKVASAQNFSAPIRNHCVATTGRAEGGRHITQIYQLYQFG
jgi:hypothetical protein